MVNKTKRFLLVACALLLMASTLCVGALAAEAPAANIPVTIRHKGAAPAEAEVCTVELTPDKPEFPMPAGTKDGVFSMEITSETSGSIVIPVTRVGVFTYTVRQISGENENCIYDHSVYQVTVYVTYSKTGELVVNLAAYAKDTQKKADLVFNNYYCAPAGVTLAAIKTMDGETPKDGAFSFQLFDSEGNVIETAKNTGRDVIFQPLVFDKAGTYTYEIKEVKENRNDIAYDTSVYQAVIEVFRNEDNDYEAKLTYKKDGKDYTGTPIFANKTIKPPVIPQTGDYSPIFLVMGLAAVSAVAIFLMLFIRYRKQKQDRQ